MRGRLILPRPRSGAPFLVVAHRGDRVHCPENSLAGYRRAIEAGADLLEADLRPTADGQFVCFHDRTLERTTDGEGLLEGKSFEQLGQCHLRSGNHIWHDERVPSLDDLIALCPQDVYLALELKSNQFGDERVCAALLQKLEDSGMRQRVVLLSFHARHLGAMAAVAPDIPGGVVSFLPWPYGEFDLLGPVVIALRLNPRYVRQAHQRGQAVCPLDASPDSRLVFYRRLGVDAVLTDDPGATVRSALRLA